MRSWRNFEKTLVLGLAILIALTISSCAEKPSPGTLVQINSPSQGDEFSPGAAVPISIQFMDGENIAEVIIRIGDKEIYRGPPPPANDPKFAFNQGSIPGDPEEHTIEVEVVDDDGLTLESALVDILVGGELFAFLPDLAITDIQLSGLDRIECHYANEGSDLLPYGRDVWIDVILGPGESEVPPFTASNIGVDRLFSAGTTGYLTTAPISPVPTWPHLVTCRIDPANEILEPDETNNSMTLTLSPSLAPLPYSFICAFDKNAFVRLGGHTNYPEVTIGEIGEEFEVLARSEATDPTWLYGRAKNGELGWTSELVLDCEGIILEKFEFMAYPDLPESVDLPDDGEHGDDGQHGDGQVKDACSAAPDDETCKKEGGKWNKNTDSCDCPES